MKVIKDSVHISGMTCIMCQNTIESALNSTNGIINAKVDYKKEKAQVEYDSDIVSITDIINVIKEKDMKPVMKKNIAEVVMII